MAQSAISHPASFSVSQRGLHWLTVVFVFFNLLMPDGIADWHRAVRRTGTATLEQIGPANIHAYIGFAILIAVIARLTLRSLHGVPDPSEEEPPVFRVIAKAAHVALYGLLIAMPLSGIAAYYFGVSVAGDLHADILKVLLWLLIAAHVGGALAHQFYWKTNALRRMTLG